MSNSELKKFIEKLEKRIDNLEKAVFGNSKSDNGEIQHSVIGEDKKGISELIDEGFFKKPQRYKDIIKQLKTNATFSKNLSYKTILNLLVKEKRLQRKMVNHQWMYSNYE